MPADLRQHYRLRAPKPRDYLAIMSRAIFQAGLSWAAIDRQWERLRAAFDDFDPVKVSKYRDAEVLRIMRTPGILHSERKIRATIRNAQTLIAIAREHGSIRTYLRSFKAYDDLVADMRKRYAFVGDVSAYYFLYRVGERVPPFTRWIKTVEGDHPRIREMVGAKAQASMSESAPRGTT